MGQIGKEETLVHLMVLLVGVVFVLWGGQVEGTRSTVYLSIGTSIVAAGLVSLLLQFFLGNPFAKVTNDIRSVSEILENRLQSAVRVLDSSARTGVVSSWVSRSDLSTEAVLDLMKGASQQIELLAYAMAFLPEHPATLDILFDRARAGCRIRILLGAPWGQNVKQRNIEEHLEGSIPSRIETSLIRLSPLLSMPEVEIRLHDTPLYCSIYRFDGNMFVTPHLYGIRGTAAPLLQLVDTEGGIFQKYVSHFGRIWDQAVEYSPNGQGEKLREIPHTF